MIRRAEKSDEETKAEVEKFPVDLVSRRSITESKDFRACGSVISFKDMEELGFPVQLGPGWRRERCWTRCL